MSQQELLTRVVRTLEQAGVEYMVTGSIASTLHGEPRATHDLDFVVAMANTAIKDLLDAFPPPRYYLDPEAIREAIDTHGMFNLIAVHDGDKADFWLLTDSAFDESRFARKQTEVVFETRLFLPTPEDTMLEKLRWVRESGGSEKHFRDALRIYEVHGTTLDQGYLGQWAAALGVTDLWERIRREAELV